MKFKHLTAVAFAALALNATATTVDWGSHDELELSGQLANAGAFSDQFIFNLPALSSLASTTVANNLTSVLGISNGTVSLYKEAGATDTLLGSYTFDGTTGSTSKTFGSLISGGYYYQVAGTATGSSGGFYSISSTVTAVPEPETYALMLAGLGAVGLIARRRSRQ